MVTFLSKKHIRFDSDGRDVVVAVIAVASASELPTPTGVDGVRFHEGTRAWDISTGDEYGMLSDGTWNKQKEKVRVDWMGGI